MNERLIWLSVIGVLSAVIGVLSAVFRVLYDVFPNWIINKAFNRFFECIKRKYEIGKNRKYERSFREKQHRDILSLDRGIPYFLPENVRAHHNPNDRFFISFPEELLSQFQQLSDEELKTLTRESESFCDLHVPGLPDDKVGELLEKSRMKIAQKFVDRADGM